MAGSSTTSGTAAGSFPFSWIDATTQTALFGDDFGGRLHLPFSFAFYGTDYDQVFISDNGYINFLSGDVFDPFPLVDPVRSTAQRRDLPALARPVPGRRQLHRLRDGGSDRSALFVLEFSDIGVRGTTATVDFEVKLHEVGETIDIVYGDNPANPGDGRGATIGIENETGTDALEFSFSDAPIVPKSAYRYQPMPSGIVHGTVTDRNDGEPIAGATVTATPGVGSTKTADDGTYSLRLHPGSYTLTFAASNYSSKILSQTLLDGSSVTRNVRLNAPVPTVDQSDVAVELEVGAAPTTRNLILSNEGSAQLVWEAKERNRGSSPPIVGPPVDGTGAWRQDVKPAVRMAVNGGGTAVAHPKAYRWTAADPTADMSILVYADDPIHPAPNTYVDQALQRLGLSYTAHYDGDFEGFMSDLNSGTWDLVIFANDNFFPFDFAIFDQLNAYVEGGGRLVLHTWVVEFDTGHPLWARLGFSFSESVFDVPADVYWWQPDHPAFMSPEVVPELTELEAIGFGIYGQRGDALDGESIAGYTTPGPDEGQAGLIVANDESTVFKGFLDAQNSADLDADGVPDSVELWQNLAFGVSSGFFSDVPWLVREPQLRHDRHRPQPAGDAHDRRS